MSVDHFYDGRDLEAMSFAVNYHRWIFDLIRSHLGHRIVEVGAGSGNFSSMLVEQNPELLCVIEPSREMFKRLEPRARELGRTVRPFNATFAAVADEIKSLAPDTIVYVNVLEHIEKDVEELELLHRTLQPGGRVVIFVPALQWLYGSFDRLIEHRRRYSRAELEEKCTRAGFRVTFSRYFDFAGIAPWWVKYRLLKSDTMESGAVQLYDRWIVPINRRIESIVAPPIGKNVILVAEKR